MQRALRRRSSWSERIGLRNGVAAQCRSGSLFDPWRGQRFNVIVDDVSGVAEPLDRLSGWYPPAMPGGAGPDGIRWVLEVLDQAPDFLTPGGQLVFPVLTLSREQLRLGHEVLDPNSLDLALDLLDRPSAVDAGKLARCNERIQRELASKLADAEAPIASGDRNRAIAKLKAIDGHYGGLTRIIHRAA